MFQDFRYRHIPALFVAAAQCWGTIWPLVGGTGTRGVLLHYGLPPRIADVPETWPVWHVGNARTACLGILMFVFYARRRYDVLDVFLAVTSGYLGLADCVLLWSVGLPSMGVFRLVSSGVFCALGVAGFTEGRKA